MSSSGFWAINAIKSVRIDTAFLGTSGFQSFNGPTAESFIEAEVKRAVVENSKNNIVLADYSKFKCDALVEYTEWNEVSCLVTDGSVQKKECAEMEGHVKIIRPESQKR